MLGDESLCPQTTDHPQSSSQFTWLLHYFLHLYFKYSYNYGLPVMQKHRHTIFPCVIKGSRNE